MSVKKKLLIILGGVVGALVTALVLIVLLVPDYDESDEPASASVSLSAEQIALSDELAGTRTGFTGTFIEMVPADEIEPLVDGVDYSSEDVKAAFESLYDGTGTVVVSSNAKTVSGPRVWVELGAVVAKQIAEQHSEVADSDFYAEMSAPEFWIVIGDWVIDNVSPDVGETGFDAEYYGAVIGKVVAEYASESEPDYDWSGVGDAVIEYITEEWGGFDDEDWEEFVTVYEDSAWEDYRENPTEEAYSEAATSAENFDRTHDQFGRLYAEYYPIAYKSTGRLFYRETLSDKQKRAYDIAATMVQNGTFELVCLFEISADEMIEAMNAVVRDFPEFFFIKTFSCVSFDIAGNAAELCLYADPVIQAVGIDSAIAQVAARVKPVVAAANTIASPIDKVKYVADYMSDTNTFHHIDWEANTLDEVRKILDERQTLWSGIVTNDPVCAGYAAAFQYFMNLIGVPAARMSSGSHAWNLVELDGDYYYMDVTWYDGSDGSRETDFFTFNEAMLQQYIDAKQTSGETHSRDRYSVKLPAANGTKYSWANWFEGTATSAPSPANAPSAATVMAPAEITSEPDDDWSDYNGEDWSDAPLDENDYSDPALEPPTPTLEPDTPYDAWSNDPAPGNETYDIPEWWESSDLIDDWSEGPTSLYEEMAPTEVIAGLAGTYAGYVKFLRHQIVITVGGDSTGTFRPYPDEPPIPFEFYYLEDVDHPMVDNEYNGMIFVTMESDTWNLEFCVVSPTALYSPAHEAIFYKVD
jgi:hypothetical protein